MITAPEHRDLRVQVLLYAQREEVEPDAVKQLIHVAESALPVSPGMLESMGHSNYTSQPVLSCAY